MRSFKKLKGKIILLQLISLVLFANTKTAQCEISKFFFRPIKITKGPYDNYQGSKISHDSKIYFTRVNNQISSIMELDLETREEKSLFEHEADAKDPNIHPSKKLIAFTYYANSIEGDICIFDPKRSKITYLTDKKSSNNTPIWVDNNNLAYLHRDSPSTPWQLNIYNTETKTHKLLLPEINAAFAFHPMEDFLVYVKSLDKQNSELVLYDQKNSKELKRVRFTISGTTGYLNFSPDGKELYFSHYLNDTNKDEIIDSQDSSVIFKISWNILKSQESEILPRQLLSINENCNFPFSDTKNLYATCSKKESLDLYQFPLNGALDLEWKKENFLKLYQVARSYEDRLFILGNLRFIDPENDFEYQKRQLWNHYYLEDFSSCFYLLDEIQSYYKKNAEPRALDFFILTEIYIKIKHLVSSHHPQTLASVLEPLRKEFLAKSSKSEWNFLKNILAILFDYYLKSPNIARKEFEKLSMDSSISQEERYLLWESVNVLFPNKIALAMYPKFFDSKELQIEERFYIANSYLDALVLDNSTEDQILKIKKLLLNIKHEGILDLLTVNLKSLEISKANEKEALGIYSQLIQIIQKYDSDIFIKRVLYVSSLKILLNNAQGAFASSLSSHWLNNAFKDPWEYPYALDQYLYLTKERAYSFINDKKPMLAGRIFYSAVRQSDDLESYYEMFQIFDTHDPKNLENTYNVLLKDKIIPNGKPFHEYLTALKAKDINIQKLEELTELLEDNLKYYADPMAHLSIGYLYHKRFLESSLEFSYDKTLFTKALENYLSVLDLSFDNDRLYTVALENIALLQGRARNFALAASYLEKRLQRVFVSKIQEIKIRYIYARFLSKSFRYQEAFDQMSLCLNIFDTAREEKNLAWKKVLLEKTAFYALYAQKYEESNNLYEQVIAISQISAENSSKLFLALGFNYYKLNNLEKSREYLSKVLNIKPIKEKPFHFNQNKNNLIASGLLANITSIPAEKIILWEKHLSFLEKLKENLDTIGMQKSHWLLEQAKDANKLAVLYSKQNKKEQALLWIKKAEENLKLWEDETTIRDSKFKEIITNNRSRI